MAKFIDNLPPNLSEDSPSMLYGGAYQKAGYKIPVDRVIENLWSKTELKDYYENVINVDKNKRVLSKDEYELVKNLEKSLMSNRFTAKFVVPDPDKEVYMQFPIYFDYMGIQGKALLDGLIIDHEAKTIQP